jgi:hypothetical protein
MVHVPISDRPREELPQQNKDLDDPPQRPADFSIILMVWGTGGGRCQILVLGLWNEPRQSLFLWARGCASDTIRASRPRLKKANYLSGRTDQLLWRGLSWRRRVSCHKQTVETLRSCAFKVLVSSSTLYKNINTHNSPANPNHGALRTLTHLYNAEPRLSWANLRAFIHSPSTLSLASVTTVH